LVVVVVPAVDDQVPPLAAYPSSARNSKNRTNPNAVSVASSAMLCLDHRRAKTLAVQKHLLTALCPIKRQAKLLLLLCLDQA
jgi:hypothetical protein